MYLPLINSIKQIYLIYVPSYLLFSNSESSDDKFIVELVSSLKSLMVDLR